jgi:hypothetical protein
VNTSKILDNQVALNEFISTCTEAQAAALLHAELHGQQRHTFITRIYSRFNRMRAVREREWLGRNKDIAG